MSKIVEEGADKLISSKQNGSKSGDSKQDKSQLDSSAQDMSKTAKSSQSTGAKSRSKANNKQNEDIKHEDEEKDKELDGINIASDRIISDNVKNKANKAKNKAKDTAISLLKNEKVIAFIIANIIPILIIIAIIIFIIWLIGVFGFFATLPGTILEKVKEFGESLWGDFSGFFVGDTVGAQVTQEDIVDLAQYIQSMGYEDLESCGFGDVEYEESDDEGSITTNKQIKKINESVDGKNYLKKYIAANESTWALANWSVLGEKEELGSKIRAVIKLDLSALKSNESYSTGMINILDSSTPLQNAANAALDSLSGGNRGLIDSWIRNELGLNKAAEYVKINRKDEKMVVYTDAVYNPIINLFSDKTIRWGSVFSYDMATWTAKYGRPTELFLAVHLSTMMPDLAYEIATNSELNTKVNLVLQDVDITYDTVVKSIDGKKANLSNDDIINAFIDYSVTGQDLDYEYEEEVEVEKIGKDGKKTKETKKRTVKGNKNFYQEILDTVGNDQEKRNTLFKDIMSQIDENDNPINSDSEYVKSINLAGALVDDSTFIGHVIKFILKLGALIHKIFTGSTKYFAYVRAGTDEVPGLDGITYNDLLELAQITAKGMDDGIENVKWPYIESVTNHWFYQDIDFTKGVYRRAKTATKKIDYEPRDTKEESALVKDNIKVQLDAELTSDKGVVYQVCEPEATGPNQTIVDIFKDKYYKYDGTEQTAKAIDNAKRYDETGKAGVEYKGVEVEEPTVEKQEVSFEENKVNALTAFSILENMHSEEGDFVYRNLKELMHTLDYFNEEDLTEELKDMLLWLIQVDEPDGKEERFNVTRNPDEYGIIIKDVEGRTVLAPENCEISSDGDVVTLTFTGLSDETVELLEYIYNGDFKIIDKDAITGITMKIKGMELDSTSGTASRGDVIGTANGDLEVVMLDVDKSRIEDVEEYMKQSNNNAYYQAVLNTKNKKYGEGIDIGYYVGDGINRGSGASSGNSAVSYGNGTWSYNNSDFDLICAITASEDRGSYEGALAVITSACNRTVSKEYKSLGSDPLTQYRAKGQYEGYYDDLYVPFLNGKSPDYVKQAVEDALKDGKRNHNYCQFRGYYIKRNQKQEQIGKNGNWYFDPIV